MFPVMLFSSCRKFYESKNIFVCPFLSPPPFGEGLYSFTRVRMYVCMYVCFRRRSEGTHRILTFNTWNRREIFPWWRRGSSKSYQSSWVSYSRKCQSTLHCLGLQKYFLKVASRNFCYHYFFSCFWTSFSNVTIDNINEAGFLIEVSNSFSSTEKRKSKRLQF